MVTDLFSNLDGIQEHETCVIRNSHFQCMLKIKLIFFFLVFIHAFYSQNTDLKLLKTLNAGDMACWDKTMKGFSFSAYPIAMASPAGILSHGYLKKDKVLIHNGYKSMATIVIAMGISTALKYSIQRERPFDAYPNEIIKRDHSGTFSFPSGHTTAAFATATSLSLTYQKWYVSVPSFAYAGLIGYSRMRLGVHYPTDVLAGALIGIGSGFLTWKIDKLLRKKRADPIQ